MFGVLRIVYSIELVLICIVNGWESRYVCLTCRVVFDDLGGVNALRFTFRLIKILHEFDTKFEKRFYFDLRILITITKKQRKSCFNVP
jgi:hypothetical protein